MDFWWVVFYRNCLPSSCGAFWCVVLFGWFWVFVCLFWVFVVVVFVFYEEPKKNQSKGCNLLFFEIFLLSDDIKRIIFDSVCSQFDFKIFSITLNVVHIVGTNCYCCY